MHEQATNEAQQSWLSAHTHTLLSKLKVIEQQLLVLTYTSDTMPALRKVDDHLTRAQRKLDARDKQVSCVLHSELCRHHISRLMLTARLMCAAFWKHGRLHHTWSLHLSHRIA